MIDVANGSIPNESVAASQFSEISMMSHSMQEDALINPIHSRDSKECMPVMRAQDQN